MSEVENQAERLRSATIAGDLVERLRRFADAEDSGGCCELQLLISPSREAADEIERLRGVIRTAIAGDWPMPRAEIYRDDGHHSKHDRCPHGNWMYEGCENCLADWLEGKLTPPVDNREGQ